MPEGATARAVPAYADAVARFSIETAAAQLDGDLERGLNACVECCDRHAKADAIALDWIDAGGQHHRSPSRRCRRCRPGSRTCSSRRA